MNPCSLSVKHKVLTTGTTREFPAHFNFFTFLIFWLRCMHVIACRLSLVAESRCYPLDVVHRLLTEVASLVAEHRPSSAVWHRGLVVKARRLSSVAQGLGCSGACRIFLDGRLNPCSLHWRVGSHPPCHQGRPLPIF